MDGSCAKTPNSPVVGAWFSHLLSETLARRIAAERVGHEAMTTSHLYELRIEAMRDA